MGTVANPSGFSLRRHPTGQSRAKAYTIDAAYATAIGFGDAVILNTNGTITVGAAASDLLGVFAGCEYIDPNGKPCASPNWPGTAGCTNIVAWVYDDPENEYEVQASAAASGYVQAAIGDQADLVAGTVNAFGRSTQALNATLKGAGVQGQFRIIGFGPEGMYDASLNTIPTVRVKIARHQFVAVKTAI